MGQSEEPGEREVPSSSPPRHCLLRVNKGRSAPDDRADPVATLSCPTLRNGPGTLRAFLFPDIFESRRRVDQVGQIKDYKTIV